MNTKILTEYHQRKNDFDKKQQDGYKPDFQMINNNAVWKNKVDNIYDVMVISEGDGYQGRLIIKNGDVELLNEHTSISFGARFGPDISNVSEWESKCLNFIDNLPKL